MSNLKIAVAALFLVFLPSCSTYKPAKDYYYLNPNKDLSAIGKVVLVELDNGSRYPHISTDVTDLLFLSLQKEQLFSLIVIRQNDLAWRNLQLELNSTIPLKQLSEIRRKLKCDAIMVGNITRFEPYPHLSMGIRLKLIDLDDGDLLWALEQIWDATDKKTGDQIKKYYNRRILPGSTSLEEELGTVSSLKFIKFVTYEIAKTLRLKK